MHPRRSSDILPLSSFTAISLTVPGEFIPPGFTNDPAQESPLKFRGNISTHFPRPASSHSFTATFVPPSLMTAKNVYVRRDGTKGPLQRPYTGPYAVLTPGDKTFLLDIGGRTERISVDRLKPAFYHPALPVQVAKPPPRGRPPTKQRRPSGGSSLQGPSASPPSGASSGSCVTREVPLYRRHGQAVKFGVLYVISDFYHVSLLGGEGGGSCVVLTIGKTDCYTRRVMMCAVTSSTCVCFGVANFSFTMSTQLKAAE